MGEVSPEMVQAMHAGVMIDDHLCRFTDIQHYGGEGINQWYHVVLMEGAIGKSGSCGNRKG